MEFKFNSYDLIKPPKIALCKIDTKMLGFIEATNIVIKPTFCSLSEVTFICYKGTNLYDSLRKYMVLDIDGFGRFQIQSADESNDGATVYKEITAYSYEVSLNKWTLTYKDDTVFKLWDAISPEKTLLGIISNQTGWTIAEVDGSLLNKYRTMSIDNEEVYGLLMGNISDAFKCYFVFDGMNKKIYCYDRERAVVNSGINLSFRNLINDMSIKENSDDITTALTVNGAEGVGINLVNPLGNNVIYDFSYFCNDEPWGMPLELQAAIKAWQSKVSNQSLDYALYVERRRNIANEKVVLDGELTVLKGELKSLQDIQSVNIAANRNDELQKNYNDIQAKEAEIKAKELEIANINSEYQDCVNVINGIVADLSFETNFTPEQYEILKYYINSSVYENENFVFTSTMTEADKIDMSNQLYQQGLDVLKKLSHPLYEFECNVAAFMFTKEYQEFAQALELGTAINLELENGVWVEPKLLQIVIDYDNPDNTTVILSDNFRLSNDIYTFSDGFNQTVKASRKASLSAPLWDEPNKNGFYTTVNDYLNNALNLVNQEIINATDQEFTLGSYGLRGKKYDKDSDTYDPHQVAMTNNVIAFTDDGWQSCKAALGNITIGNTNYYGLVAEAIVGNLIAGDQLTIANQNNSFVVDGNGATLKNADLTVENGVSRIVISPDTGFKIQKKDGSSWKDMLSEDSEGYIVAKAIKLEESNIGGWTIQSDRLSSPTGDYIASNGTGKLSLLTWNNSQATFNGNIYANNLYWRYGDTDYAKLFSSIDGLGVMFDGSGLPNGEELLFGGKIYIGTVSNNSQIYSKLDYVSTEAPSQQSIFLHANGNINLECDVGMVRVTSDGGFSTKKLAVSGTSTFVRSVKFFDDVEVDGKMLIYNADVENELAVKNKLIVDQHASFRGEVWFENDQLIGVVGEDGAHYAATREITIDGQTLKFVHGLLV